MFHALQQINDSEEALKINRVHVPRKTIQSFSYVFADQFEQSLTVVSVPITHQPNVSVPNQ